MNNQTIDIESYIYNYLYTKLTTAYTNISVYTSYPRKPASFPCVTIEMTDDVVVLSRRTAESINNASSVSFEINVFSNLASGAKTQCKTIMNDIDVWLADIGFTRMFNSPTPNLIDATISRRTARYMANVTQKTEVVGDSVNYEYFIYQN